MSAPILSDREFMPFLREKIINDDMNNIKVKIPTSKIKVIDLAFLFSIFFFAKLTVYKSFIILHQQEHYYKLQ